MLLKTYLGNKPSVHILYTVYQDKLLPGTMSENLLTLFVLDGRKLLKNTSGVFLGLAIRPSVPRLGLNAEERIYGGYPINITEVPYTVRFSLRH